MFGVPMQVAACGAIMLMLILLATTVSLMPTRLKTIFPTTILLDRLCSSLCNGGLSGFALSAVFRQFYQSCGGFGCLPSLLAVTVLSLLCTVWPSSFLQTHPKYQSVLDRPLLSHSGRSIHLGLIDGGIWHFHIIAATLHIHCPVDHSKKNNVG